MLSLRKMRFYLQLTLLVLVNGGGYADLTFFSYDFLNDYGSIT